MYEILSDRSIIEVSGEEASVFLQRLITGDVIKNSYSYNYIINNQGRYLFDFFVFKESGEKLLLDLDSGKAPFFIEKLSFYKLRAKVAIKEVSDNYSAIYSEEANPSFNAIATFRDPRFKKLGFRNIAPKISGEGKKGLYYRDKYNFAVPDGLEDLIYEKSMIVEFGAKDLMAVDFAKGCYLGQEAVSMATYRGTIRKMIFKITSESDLTFFEQGSEIISKNEKIGFLTSSYKNSSIAVIREEQFLALGDNREVLIRNAEGVEAKALAFVPEWRI